MFETTAALPAQKEYFAPLDILRTIAVLQVVFAHGATAFLRDLGPVADGLVSLLITLNFGVPLFFILSGFLMAQQLSSAPPLTRFYRNRAAKIYPTYFILITALFFSRGDITITDYLLHVAGIYNWFPAYVHSISGHLWSLAVEMQFYLLIPWFYRQCYQSLTSGKLLIWLLAAFGAAAAYGLLAGTQGQAASLQAVLLLYGHTLVNVSALVLGVLLHRRHRSGQISDRPGWKLLAALLIMGTVRLLVLPGNDIARVDLTQPLAVLGVILLIFLWQAPSYFLAQYLLQRQPVGRPVFRLVAGVSYQWYLLHVVVLQLVVLAGGTIGLSSFLIFLVMSFAGAYASTRWLETPLLQLIRKRGS